MAFDLQNFRSQMQFDGARPNLFEFNMVIPFSARGTDSQRASTKFTFMARAGQMPGSSVNPIPVMYFGRELKFAGNRTFPEWTVTIINDEDFALRNAFELWMSNLNSHVGNVRAPNLSNPESYVQDILITQFGKEGPFNGRNNGEAKGIKQYSLVGAFPIDVSPIELDWGANDQIEEFTVTFAYQYWTATTSDPTYNPQTTGNPVVGVG